MVAHQAAPVPGILQARILERVAISFSNAWKWKAKEVTQSCSTLSDSMDCSLPGSSIHGLFQARVPEWVAIAFSDFQSYIPPNSSFRQFCAYRICSLSLKCLWPLHDIQCLMSCVLPSFRLLCRTDNELYIKTAQVSPNKLWRDQSVSKKFKYNPQQISIIFARIIKKKNYPSSNFFQPWWSNRALELCFSMHTSSLELHFAKTKLGNSQGF